MKKDTIQQKITIKGEKFKIKVPVGGIHFVYNAICAVTVGTLLGLNQEQIKQLLKLHKRY